MQTTLRPMMTSIHAPQFGVRTVKPYYQLVENHFPYHDAGLRQVLGITAEELNAYDNKPNARFLNPEQFRKLKEVMNQYSPLINYEPDFENHAVVLVTGMFAGTGMAKLKLNSLTQSEQDGLQIDLAIQYPAGFMTCDMASPWYLAVVDKKLAESPVKATVKDI